ncbi:MAG: HD-GYP domain-containing protein [Armatimonadota bacterium]|nr:MAG: HD-GYP domain-containing protein [Armatimonadota bacterium]
MIRTFFSDTDNRRKEIVWLALALLGVIVLTFFIVLYLGHQVPVRSRDEGVMLVGLVAFLACAIAYFAGKEKEQRHLNQSLVHSLQDAVRELHNRVGLLDELNRANGELGESVSRLQGELDQTYPRTLQALMNALDARDDYTAVHGEEVTSIAAAIAKRMGLRDDLVEIIERFGPLHDIGKIGIPDDVLHKAEPLSAEEVVLFRQHPTMGEGIIRPLHPSPEALAMVRSHHERWDGDGYPDGLVGAAIPLLARILCVADSYHAIISRRPYQPARERRPALRELAANAGTQFDPDVVGVLTELELEGTLHVRGAR